MSGECDKCGEHAVDCECEIEKLRIGIEELKSEIKMLEDSIEYLKDIVSPKL